MNFREYQLQTYKNIQPHTNNKDEVLNWSIGLSEEVGETLKHIKHQYWGKEDIDKKKIASELGDVLWYLSALCSSLDINLDVIAVINAMKLNYRYGKEFTYDKSKNRHELEKKFEETEAYKEVIKNL